MLTQLQQPGSVCAEPQVALAILVKGLDASRAAAGTQNFEAVLGVSRDRVLGSDPERTLAILEKMENAAGGQAISSGLPGEVAGGGENAERAGGGDVKIAVGTREDRADRVVWNGRYAAAGPTSALCDRWRVKWNGGQRAVLLVEEGALAGEP